MWAKGFQVAAMMLIMMQILPAAYSQEAGHCSSDRSPRTISLIRLIANRSDCDGELIRVAGYLAGNGLDNAAGIFVSDSDGRNGVYSNAISVKVDQKIIKGMWGKYVMITGRYHAPGQAGFFNGYINEVVEVKLLNTDKTTSNAEKN